MGYDIYITRRDTWYDDEGPEITPEEWKAVVDADPRLILLDQDPENPLNAKMHSTPNPYHGVRYFHYNTSDIRVKKPNKETLLKMLHIAKILGARVIGEADEIYAEDGTPDKATQYTVRDGW
ncbi:hypothetical protein JIN84_05715 [Luteolibacter yonseiensis]|uniref:Uncharacterized protein n=1 Tax=Luteolibacter yonseiensis TaxID=1144680 RepID=A0A934R2W9_9BACT|nr:hypothetical protein [Luteolibacter yonseiensis]MBK1815098.1 hypothetical protein [Luteolibacter yonseiensis]